MTELRLLDASAAAAALGAAGPSARGFLGLDPVVHNDELMARALTARNAVVFAAGAGQLLGAARNPDNPRQADVATTGDDHAALAALLEFLLRHLRCTSFVGRACTPEAAAVFTACGFTSLGRLTDHVYRAGAYHDEQVLHHQVRHDVAARPEEQPCDPC